MIRPDVPIMNLSINEHTCDEYLKQVKAANAGRVWIALERHTLFCDRQKDLQNLYKNLRFFEKNGIEAGVWIQAFGFGTPLSKSDCSWTRLRSVTGKEKDADAFCPEDPDFMTAYLDWVKDIARLSPRLIMLDDDLCMSVRPGIGCFCDRHIKLLESEVGQIKDLTKMFTGGKNKYRDAWYKVMGNSVRDFCKKVRAAVDSVDPTIRVGVCAGYTSWDIEGTDPIEMSQILAGDTAPFFRLTSAPYWVKSQRFAGQRLSAVIENARNQIAWCKESGIEYFAEADSYPRPCYNVPAMLIENFDIIMHATGTKSLKYMFDYVSSPWYEKQYLKIHTRNIPLYEKIEKAFCGAVPCGVRVYRPAHRITDAILPSEFIGEKPVMRSYFSLAAALIASNGIPVCYDGDSECAAVFGDDALYFKNIHKKTVLDITAALILKDKGIDVGIEAVSDAKGPEYECFENEKVQLLKLDGAKFKNVTLKQGAVVKSKFDTGAVASFEYNGFLVLCFDALSVNEASALYCSYERARQLQSFFEYPYPAICGYAELYCVCAKRKSGHVAVFQNHSIDPVFDFDIMLPKRCRAFKLYGAEGVNMGNKIHITTDFLPQSTILLEVEY